MFKKGTPFSLLIPCLIVMVVAPAAPVSAQKTDKTPPVIKSINLSQITKKAASISWKTNEVADTQVEYGATTEYGNSVRRNNLRYDHQVDLTNLAPATTYNFRVKSKDAAGNMAVSENQIFKTPGNSQRNKPPTVSITASAKSGTAPLIVNFAARGSDPDGTVVLYQWTFGDGKSSTGASVSNTYQSPGTFTASVKVTDNKGATANASVVINVAAPVVLTASSLSLNPSSVVGGNSTQGVVTLSGAAPAGGALVTLVGGSIATTPAGVTVPAGSSSAAFTIGAKPVTASTSVVISASYGGATKSATLVVNPSSQPPASAQGLPPQSGGTTYYVSTTGSDSNPGTSSQPFRTVQKGVNVVNPGDTVIVRDGVYNYQQGLNSCYGRAMVCMTRGGTATNWVVIKSENRWGARLDGQNVANDGFLLDNNIGYVRIEGLDIYNLLDTGGSPEGGLSAQGFNLYSGGHNVQIVGNHIHHISNHCTTDGGVAIYIKKNNVLVEGNVINDVRNYAVGEQGCQKDNPNHSHGIYLSGNSSDPNNRASGAIIRNNIFFGITSGWPIHFYPGTLDNIKVLNNTFADANPRRNGQIIIYSVTLSNSVIQNNIFYQPTTSAIFIGVSNVTLNNVVISHNLMTSAQVVDNTPQGSGIRIEQNLVGANPGMINPSDTDPNRRDFRLVAGSRAIDAGAVVPVAYDFVGRARPQGGGYDIGAYEYP